MSASTLYDPKRPAETGGSALTYNQDIRQSQFCVFCPADSHSHLARCCGEACPYYICPASLIDGTAYCHDDRCSSLNPRPVFCDGIDACHGTCYLCVKSSKPASFCGKHIFLCENCSEFVCQSHSHGTDSDGPEGNADEGDEAERICHECQERMIVD